MTTSPQCRQSVIAVLGVLSSSQKQLAYERDVPSIPVTDELLSMWFDDTYLPDSPAFQKSFSAQELLALADFNKFFDEHIEDLQDKGRVSDWLKIETWQQIIQRAEKVLALIAQ